MNYLPLQIPQELSDYVESAFYLWGYTPEHEIERLIPDGLVSLVIELDGKERYIYNNEDFEVIQTCRHSWLSGMHNQYISISSIPDTELIGIRFKAGGIFPFINSNVHNLFNKVVDASEYFTDTIDSLRTSLIREESPQQKLAVLEKWLLEQLRYEDSLNPAIRNACQKIVADPSISTLEQIKTDIPYSEKQFIHNFKHQVGITPKVFQRILRFNQILPKIQQKETVEWAEISEACGYFDQPHFIRDFKQFSGFNPSEFLDSSSGRTNFIPLK
jgi:AraC-like DNA-binding protein